MRRAHLALLAGSCVVAVIVACGSSNDAPGFGSSSGDGTSSGVGPGFGGDDSGLDPNGIIAPITIEPVDQVVQYTGAPGPTVQYVAKLVSNGQPIPAVFSIDRGEIGNVNASSGLFTASGNAGGKATITAAYGGATATTSITVKVKAFENGGTPIADAGGGSGGLGGVGGHGPGGPVDDPTIGVLRGNPQTAPNLKTLYPYDGTVWPRGILAPLLMWNPGAPADFDAIQIKLTEANYEFEGVYKKNASPFRDHPITQKIWKQLLQSNAGEDVTVSLVFAKGTTAYTVPPLKWKVASAPLKGIVYYNSYGTKLAQNYGPPEDTGALPAPRTRFGGATLGIRGNSTDPILVAGSTNSDKQYCRVCHSVAANGSVLITQGRLAEDQKFYSYDLKASYPIAPTSMSGQMPGNVRNYAWPAIYPDGTMFLGDSSSAPGSSDAVNQLYQVVAGGGAKTPTPIATSGWPGNLRTAFSAFSPDGKNLAFTMYAGPAGADQKTLAMMPFDKAQNKWGILKKLHKPANANHYALYPAFLPTNDAVVFEVETANGGDYGGTRNGARGELWWVHTDTPGQPIAKRLDRLNGLGYIPDGASGHDNDETLNYEPTVNPVPSGGYAWVVFTSRRMYGNVATIDPFHSDPRDHDLSVNPTTKKLWVAAIDLNAPANSDPSHPAFYLPAQELLAGNSRGYWVVDPCKNDGNECESGDECCGGFCRPDQAGKLVCSNVVPQCAQEYENCKTNADCCNSALKCINARCAAPGPK
jgi:hypothetical protein